MLHRRTGPYLKRWAPTKAVNLTATPWLIIKQILLPLKLIPGCMFWARVRQGSSDLLRHGAFLFGSGAIFQGRNGWSPEATFATEILTCEFHVQFWAIFCKKIAFTSVFFMEVLYTAIEYEERPRVFKQKREKQIVSFYNKGDASCGYFPVCLILRLVASNSVQSTVVSPIMLYPYTCKVNKILQTKHSREP